MWYLLSIQNLLHVFELRTRGLKMEWLIRKNENRQLTKESSKSDKNVQESSRIVFHV